VGRIAGDAADGDEAIEGQGALGGSLAATKD